MKKISNALIYFGIILSLFFTSCDQKEVLKLENNGESIYFIMIEWGMGDSRMAIGLDKDLKGGFANEYPDKYQFNNQFVHIVFYKLENDTLHVYGDFIEPKNNNFKTNIKINRLSDSDWDKLLLNYKEKGLSIFPESLANIK